jgi:hypothetical protein
VSENTKAFPVSDSATQAIGFPELSFFFFFFFFFLMALQPFVGPWPLSHFPHPYTVRTTAWPA